MATAVPSAALATIRPAFTDAERLALAGFLARYRGLAREACALDLRQFASWCRDRSLALFSVRRGHRGLRPGPGSDGPGPGHCHVAAVHHAGSCKYAVEEDFLDRSPAAHVRRPRVDYESHAVALDRNDLGALLVAAGLGPPAGHALISLLALNGLRVSAIGADIEHLGLERGHLTLTITREGGKVSPSRWRRGPPGRSTWPSGNAPKTGVPGRGRTAAGPARDPYCRRLPRRCR